MRKVIVEAEVSLDGIMNGPGFWEHVFEYHSDDVTDYLKSLMFAPDALLMGRITYEIFAQVWPSREGKDAERMNNMPKYVASKTLQGPLAWNATLLKGDTAREIGRLKQEPGKDLLQYGVGELTNTMLRHGLVDELRLLVYPFAFGKGSRVFENINTTALTLIDTQTFKSGVVALLYTPRAASASIA
jgi:dihydrofolate reductase